MTPPTGIKRLRARLIELDRELNSGFGTDGWEGYVKSLDRAELVSSIQLLESQLPGNSKPKPQPDVSANPKSGFSPGPKPKRRPSRPKRWVRESNPVQTRVKRGFIRPLSPEESEALRKRFESGEPCSISEIWECVQIYKRLVTAALKEGNESRLERLRYFRDGAVMMIHDHAREG